MGADAFIIANKLARENLTTFSNKLAFAADDKINRGVTGIVANKLVQFYNVPAIVITFLGETGIGSVRSCRNFNLTGMLESMSELFINHGGHNFAAGFSFDKKNFF